MKSIKHRPVTSLVMVLLALYFTWLSLAIYNTNALAKGPTTLFKGETWAVLYLIAAGAVLLRLFTAMHYRIDMLLHLIPTMVVVAWTITFLMGPVNTAQPSYTLLSIFMLISPYFNVVAHRLEKKGYYKS